MKMMLKVTFLTILCLVAYTIADGVDPIFGQNPFNSPQQDPDPLNFGDMMLTKKQKEALKNGENMGGNGSNNNGYAAVKGNNLRWTNAIVPYEIDCSIENLDDAVLSVKKAMAEWEAKTCIRFVKRTNEKYFLRFFRNTHCWGNVGMTSYTSISVGYGCEYQHVMTHEIGHAIGFYHEQNRKDRDQYVKVHWENIGQFKDAFDIVQNTDSLGEAYDYESIMHYPWNAFSSNGKDTMSPKQDVTGKRPYVALSKGDAIQTSKMYNCKAILRKRQAAANIKHPGEIREKRDIRDCVDKNKYCADWAKHGHCSISSYVLKYCKLSCKSPSCSGSDCIDRDPLCPTWKSWGHCSINPTVAYTCQKSCNPTCSGTTTPTQHPPVTQPTRATLVTRRTNAPNTLSPTSRPSTKFLGKGILCIDSHASCDMWAKQGECQSNPGWMMRNCMKSCKSTNCDNGVQKPQGSCANPLGLSFDGSGSFKIPDSAFSSPANLSPGGGWQASAMNARLYMPDDYTNKRIGSWCAASHNQAKSKNGYVQVDLGQQKRITYIATQGRDKYFERVDQFKIQTSNDGNSFTTYQENGIDKVFDGNCDHVTPVLNQFTTPLQTRFIRYIPISWNYPCVRMELYGC